MEVCMKIKNCPRCGGPAVLDARTLIAYIRCLDCGFNVMGDDREDATRAWNEIPEDDGECESCRVE